VVGGGQLARMIALDAARLGVDVRVLAGAADEGVRGLFTVVDGDHDDPAALRRLADRVDVVTFDHELVPLHVVMHLEGQGVVVRPSSATLAFADKLHQRRELAAAGLPVPPFAEVNTRDAVEAFGDAHGWPLVLKAPHGGYDGRGVAVVASAAEATDMLQAAAGRALLVEPHLALRQELAVLVVTAVDGQRQTYAPVESVQVDGMCREVHAARGHLPGGLAAGAVTLAEQVADAVGSIGVLAVELFVVDNADGTPLLLVNEIAPRPHNSGHHTIDACITSQFENHARAVLGWPLGSVAQRDSASVMVNVIGTAGDPRDRVPRVDPDVKIHLYGKTSRPGRKIGHVTVVGPDHAQAAARARAAAAVLENQDG
ncbi:MAG TPA: 5-(carboxyamino)imidazole ribonucleotide synthase, partial [Euzebya sp.]|nr:5-(carboxyamino)imidazole ribonucleotide synthase [Euzebya sp.]